MKKIKLGVIFGGESVEHEVSIESAESILTNLDKNKYEIYSIYINKNGEFYEYNGNLEKIEVQNNIQKIENVLEYLKNLEVIFPVLHGMHGEDGTIQGLFELLKIPYVGCGVLASSVGMDKIYTKKMWEQAGINQAEYLYIQKRKTGYYLIDKKWNEEKVDMEKLVEKACKTLSMPIFVKPSHSGSSVGINKAKTKGELAKYIEEASKYDTKIILEQGIIGQELECAVMGNEEAICTCVGEIKSADEFYTYDAKYKNKESKTLIPANISKEVQKEIQETAIKAYKAIDAKGLSRVDFFLEEKTNRVIANEINTLPGFTKISMYPKLWEASGILYKELLDKLIELALED